MKKDDLIIITGGHLTPAFAVVQELRKRGYENILWVGRKKSMIGDESKSAEYKTCKKNGIPFKNLDTGKVSRSWGGKEFIPSLKNLFKIPLGFLRALLIVLKFRPKLIISFGGYIAVPVVIAGWLRGVPSVTHEQTATTGLANKVIAKFAKKIFISWKVSAELFNKDKVVLTGNPVRKEVFEKRSDKFEFENDRPTVYITGGNQGAHVINQAVEEVIKSLLQKHNVIHQCGSTTVTKDLHKLLKLKKRLPKRFQHNYIVQDYVYPSEIGAVFNRADLVVSRSGANTVTELLALGKPTILIPIPWSSNNEQMKNAQMMRRTGLAKILKQGDLSGDSLKQEIKDAFEFILNKKDFKGRNIAEAQNEAQRMVKLDAAGNIVDEIERVG